jgi:drug/metabolite transporter (DMT)-like permease
MSPIAKIGVDWKVVLIVGYYALCSSTLLVINKVTVHNLPAPTTILYIQLGFTAVVIWTLGRVNILEVDRLEWQKAKSFILVTLGFAATLYANMKTLQHSNVETFITFRSSTPLVISVLDYIYLGRALPGLRSAFCLVGLLVGSAGYMITDSAFKVRRGLYHTATTCDYHPFGPWTLPKLGIVLCACALRVITVACCRSRHTCGCCVGMWPFPLTLSG